ncbi:hypothetical protein KIN20_005964 [Parelaphostrongylus tenuis]|uniref:Uncharacterized protein n=1 Tax=Parelaphostrongylus tenuis TaxID=148309 RepID=A0AAD5M2X8_PARTN|nr:hypothetical protein KIN20_005964 [Parelaphostrongylus tenuis]
MLLQGAKRYSDGAISVLYSGCASGIEMMVAYHLNFWIVSIIFEKPSEYVFANVE